MELIRKCRTFIWLIILLYLLTSIPKANHAQVIIESGDLFTEISEIISTMPGASGNDYNDPGVSELISWESIMDNILAGNYTQADITADLIGYDIVEFTDISGPEDKVYYILKSNGSNYWGTYVYNPDYCRPLVIQVTHPIMEINIGKEGIYVFQKTEALFYSLTGTGRCNSSTHSACDGTTSVCSSGSENYRISDMSHSVTSIFQKTTEILFNEFSNSFFVQLHGFGKLGSDPYVILSNGTQITPGIDYSSLLRDNLLIEDNTLTFKIAHIDLSWTRLRGFLNTQGRLINLSPDPCSVDATTTTGRFLHVEQERTKLRDDETGWIKMANALVNTFTCYPFLWNGSSGTDWGTSSNWRSNNVPASSDNVTIPNKLNNPVINEEPGSPALCNHLEIQSGASISIKPGKAITVSGTFNNFGSLSIKSNAEGTGSLIHSTNNVSASVKCFLSQEKWHFIGMPVANHTASVFYLPGGSDIYLRTHIESTNTWDDWIVPVNTPLVPGRGYECWVDDNVNQDETIEFFGPLNTGDYTTGAGYYELQYTSGHGLNLICNPYPSALQANIGSWVKNNVANSVWTWSDAFGNYVYWGSGNNYGGDDFGTLTSGIIPAMQAFFVEATASTPSLTIPQSDRVHSNQEFYKDSEDIPNTIRIDVEGNEYQDAIYVSFNEQATFGFDLNYDVRKIYGLLEAPQLYSIIGDEILSINTLPETDDYTFVQLGFKCDVQEIFTIKASGTESFESDIEIYLEDLEEGILHNLSLNPFYSFDNNPANNPDRFVLHFGSTNGLKMQNQNTFNIFAKGNEVYIYNPRATKANIVIHDITGREVLNENLKPATENTILVEGNPGWYIVSLFDDGFIMSEKVFMR